MNADRALLRDALALPAQDQIAALAAWCAGEEAPPRAPCDFTPLGGRWAPTAHGISWIPDPWPLDRVRAAGDARELYVCAEPFATKGRRNARTARSRARLEQRLADDLPARGWYRLPIAIPPRDWTPDTVRSLLQRVARQFEPDAQSVPCVRRGPSYGDLSVMTDDTEWTIYFADDCADHIGAQAIDAGLGTLWQDLPDDSLREALAALSPPETQSAAVSADDREEDEAAPTSLATATTEEARARERLVAAALTVYFGRPLPPQVLAHLLSFAQYYLKVTGEAS